jgi:hypothetical protein
MNRSLLASVAVLALVLAGGCSTANSRYQKVSGTVLPDAKTKAAIKRGVIEPGYTPEMVYLALGKPTIPSDGIVDATRDGEWIYREFGPTSADRDFVRAGYRRRVVFDPSRRSDVIITEPLDTKAFPNLEPHSLHVTFRDGRVVDIKRVADI